MLFRRLLLSTATAAALTFSCGFAFAQDASFPLDQYKQDLKELIAIDSKTGHLEGVNKVIDLFADRYKGLGWTVTLHPTTDRGNILIATNTPNQDKYDVILSAHADTVQAVGNAEKYPLRIEGNIAHGAGVADDKSSLTALWWLTKDLPKSVLDKLNIAVIINPTEESGTGHSHQFLENEGKKATYALVYEPGRPGNGVVYERKGSIPLHLEFFGKPAHAGNNPEEGRNAIEAMVRAVPKIKALQDKYPGVTINADLVSGGTTFNTIAEKASVTFDFRFTNNESRNAVLAEVRKFIDEGFGDGITVKFNPRSGAALAVTPESKKLHAIIDEAAAELGQPKLKWMSVGGASDANKFASGGAAVACALGVVGGNLHDSEKEWSDLSTVEPRIQLGKRVLEKIASMKQ